MIVSRAPVRFSLGGGGTDLPSFYGKYGGFLISGAINKYILVGANQQFYNTISLKYSKIEVVKKIDDIRHNLFREALRYVGITNNIELTSLADVPSGSGLGSSGAFLIALLNTLYIYKAGAAPTKRKLAEDACKIELDILKEHEGKQDKYTCAFGGIRAYEFKKDGSVSVVPLINEDIITLELEDKLSIFFTGRIRKKAKASDALKNQDEKTKANDQTVTNALHKIKNIGLKTKDAFENGDFDKFGNYLNDHWKIKKEISPPKDPFINECYDYAIDNGALGGKVMGANTDAGFFMFYYPGTAKERWEFEDKMKSRGLTKMPFKFDKNGVTLLFNGEK